MLGKLLDRRYQVTQVLGSGGFGKTYLALDTRRPGNPTCVVKQLKPLTSETAFLETARRLFNSEAETLEQLGNHDQIPRLLAYFEEDKEFYLVQEFIQGHTLSQELQPGQRWDESRVITLLEEVLSILEFVHSKGVIHRDIKPDNLIRRNSDNKLVLVDFGAVKQVRTQMAGTYQASNTVAVGTPGYMASEQALGQPRPSSDIYALGVIGIQALTGLMPSSFQDDPNTGEILWQHQVSVGRGLANVLTKMVRYHFKDRYQSATEALQALRQLNASYLSTPSPTMPVSPGANGYRTPEPPPRSNYPAPASEKQTLPVSPGIPATPPTPPRQRVQPQPSVPQPSSSSSPLPIIVSLVVLISAGIGIAYGMKGGSFTGLIGDRNEGNASNDICTVTVDALNVRSQPNGDVIRPVNRGTSLKLTGNKQNNWVEIRSPVEGWVFNKMINCAVASQPPVETQPSPTPVKQSPTPQPSQTPSKPKPVDSGKDKETLAKAAEDYQSGNLDKALKAAASIPKSSPAYQEAQAKIQQWQKEWTEAETKFNQIQTALDEGRYIDVIKYATGTDITDQKYWRDKFKQLIEEAKKRKAEEDASQGEQTPPPESPGEENPTPEPTQSVSPSPSPVEENPPN